MCGYTKMSHWFFLPTTTTNQPCSHQHRHYQLPPLPSTWEHQARWVPPPCPPLSKGVVEWGSWTKGWRGGSGWRLKKNSDFTNFNGGSGCWGAQRNFGWFSWSSRCVWVAVVTVLAVVEERESLLNSLASLEIIRWKWVKFYNTLALIKLLAYCRSKSQFTADSKLHCPDCDNLIQMSMLGLAE